MPDESYSGESGPKGFAERWKRAARALKVELGTLYYLYHDPRVPRRARLLAACVLGYALSPIDLIPDFIPVLGYLDDLVLVPLGIWLTLRLVPGPVLAECRQKAKAAADRELPANRVAAGLIVAAWLLVIALVIAFIARRFV